MNSNDIKVIETQRQALLGQLRSAEAALRFGVQRKTPPVALFPELAMAFGADGAIIIP